MEEKNIIQSVNKNKSKLLVITICALIIGIISFLVFYPQYKEASDAIHQYWDAKDANEDLYKSGSEFAVHPDKWEKENDEYRVHLYDQIGKAKSLRPIVIISAVLFVVCGYMWLYAGRTQIVVTNKRIYGTAVFGKHVDVPLNSIVMVQIGNSKKITLATSAGKVTFAGLDNRNQVYNEIQTLIANK